MRRWKRRRFTSAQKIDAAYMAGAGASASEIKENLGFSSTSQVYRLLKAISKRLTPKSASQTSFVVVISKEAFEDVERIAGERGADPHLIASQLIENAVEKSDVARMIIAMRGAQK